MTKRNSWRLSFASEAFYKNLSVKYADKELFIFRDGKGNSCFLTGEMLSKMVRAMGSKLQGSLKPQEKAIIILPQGLEYICSLLACFYANVTAIPTSITSIEYGTEITEKIMPVLLDSKATCIITDSRFKDLLDKNQNFAASAILNVDDIDENNFEYMKPRVRSPKDTALLLYTSGSTAKPKGVMLTHSNVMDQAMAGAEQWDVQQNSCIVSWMPQFHNFGLFFNIMAPLLKGASSIILPPDSFVKKPRVWFEMIDHYQATHTAAPNFAFDYCCSSIGANDVSGLSLGSLQAIVCGGEAIRKETYENFVKAFKDMGLKDNIFCPHYGMSEMGSATTLRPGQPIRFLSLDIPSLEKGKIKISRQNSKSKYAASCGETSGEVRVLCVSQETGRLCQEDEVGEIWIKSPSIGKGYFNQPEETERTFNGALEDVNETGFFRTGDLGFIRENHLYIIGREKEVIIIHGKNYHPVDIEWTIKKNLPSLTLPVCVFSREIDQQEKVIVVQETEVSDAAEYRRIAQEILDCVSETHILEVYEINLVMKGAIPRTDSGKIQRKNCRNLYQHGKLSQLYQYRTGAVQRQENVPALTILDFERGILEKLKNEVFCVVLNIGPEELEEVKSFGELGFDSIKYVQASKLIEEAFKIQFAPVMMFKHRNIRKLAQYLSTQVERTETATIQQPEIKEAVTDSGIEAEDMGIAVIGISCNFPGEATSPRLFWENIVQDRDCISAISQSRSQVIEDYQGLHGDSSEFAPQWGGFIKDVDRFDAAFFGISPLEAESMDPQQRKVLELTWSVIEDGGYDPVSLAGNDVGLFIGVHSNDYAELIAKRPGLMDTYGAYLDSGLHMSMITHRVSRWFDFHGPSEIVNTACSSSLVSVHHAIEAIHRGECAVAIAGGINLILSSRIYTASHKAGMLSKDGHCKTFDEQADGFVRSEGYGAVLLKPYKEALKDNDTIYGIIRSTAVNHDGQSNSLRAPNLNAQKQLIKSAYNKAGIPAGTISYIETHGTGTALGDPIEFQALQEAFQEMGTGTISSFCGLGAVKTVIGHCESAAGIAGLIKVLLSMKAQVLPGILHFQKLNPYISLEGTPFYIVDKTQKWKRFRDSGGQEVPRRAGISAFGFGGANAHVVVEEYIPLTNLQKVRDTSQRAIITLSAKNRERLLVYACQFLNYLEQASDESLNLSDLAYTLQVGRSSMEERVAFLADNIRELKGKIGLFVEGKENIADCWYGNNKKGTNILSHLGSDEDSQELISKWFAKNKLNQIAQCWAQGGNISWHLFYKNDKPYRINLPTYPFAETRYWIPEPDPKTDHPFKGGAVGAIHPLLQQNTSDLNEQRFSSTFTGKEFFLSDHIVKGQSILPGVIHLEMARASLENSSRELVKAGYGVKIKDVIWNHPIFVDKQPVQVHIALFPEENGQVLYEIYTGKPEGDLETVVHSQGSMTADSVDALVLDLDSIRAECNTARLLSEQLYERFGRVGIDYGPSHRGVEEVLLGKGIALAKLNIPSAVMGTLNQFILHPSMLDAALQASSALLPGDGQRLALPFEVKELEILSGCCPSMWAKIEHCNHGSEHGKIDRFNIELCDDGGNVCVRIKELALVSADKEAGESKTLLFYPEWKEQPVSREDDKVEFDERLLILLEPEQELDREVASKMAGIRCVVLRAHEPDLEERYKIYAIKLLDEIKRALNGKPNRKMFIIQIIASIQGQQKVFMGLTGMLRTACLENPGIIGQVICVDSWRTVTKDILNADSNRPWEALIKYSDGKRYIFEWNTLQGGSCNPGEMWKDGGVYLVTGGMGGLGMLFAKEIVQKSVNPTLILTGRSALDDEKKNKIRELKEQGARIEYEIVDVAQKQAVHTLVQGIIERFGKLNGIIHSAGVIHDSYIMKKTEEELKEVMAAKVQGLVNLDQASEAIPLDFLILFSSIAGSMGNPGQADYAAANAFMDYYAVYRNELAASQKRSGHTLSVNWPLWEEGGMHVNPDIKRLMQQKMGMVPMKTSHGIESLYRTFASGKGQVMVIEGNEDTIRAFLEQQAQGIVTQKSFKGKNPAVSPAISQELLEEKAVNYFKNLLSSVIRLPAQEIDADSLMEKYGIDSIMIMQLTSHLEKTFGILPKTLFFEYQSIKALTGYFLEAFTTQLIELLGLNEEAVGTASVQDSDIEKSLIVNEPARHKRSRFKFENNKSINAKPEKNEDIAVIGLAGRYPGSRNVHEFWKNIKDGKDCITEIPKERWDHSIYFDENKNVKGKTYTKWGGFIEGVDEFDPLFFNISPREAEMMDPQERLFLQCVYEAVEDAGYSREGLAEPQNVGKEGNVGVFVGVMFEEYQLYGAQEQTKGRNVAISGNIASIANRVSYFYNLHGPSMAVDTMCSSSLTALHLACQSLYNSGCGLAIAGGVNVSIHPNKYLLLAQGNFASSKGRCESFGQGGDGYVPGEGVGALLLKPLSKAIEDGNHIYGVIKATAINHGGKTNGYTVPNPNAQAEVIEDALKSSGIDPRTINYLEAHGTGTSLGDPIEIAGLTKVFRKFTNENQFCAIGSVKSNIGHCESATGVAGITKILMQLKHGQLVPSLHSKVLNPNIDFSSTPFSVQQELAKWDRVELFEKGRKKEYPRRAGISSFGAGGSNAHAIIEEYIPAEAGSAEIKISQHNPAIIVLSAKNEERLREQAENLLAALKSQQFSYKDLVDIAYTLQVGRSALEERLAITVTSLGQLEDKLNAYLENKGHTGNIYRGHVKGDKGLVGVLGFDEDIQKAIESWISKRKYEKLLDLWVAGLDIDWERLYTQGKPKRVSLPAYPFARERYWLQGIQAATGEDYTGSQAVNLHLHPLLHRNTSNLEEQRFSSTFTGSEFFLRDHVVMGEKILPGAAYLEMTRVAIDQSVPRPEESVIRLKNIVWSRPFRLSGKSMNVHIGIYPEEAGDISYEIYSEGADSEGDAIVHCQGRAVLVQQSEIKHREAIDIQKLIKECSGKIISRSECYRKFSALGIDYGSGHQGIEHIFVGEGKVLAKLSMPQSVREKAEDYILHPSVMDSAIQAAIGLSKDSGSEGVLSLPFALEELEILDRCVENMWVFARRSEIVNADDKTQKIDIDLCDENGKIHVRMKSFVFRALEAERGVKSETGAIMLYPFWKESGIAQAGRVPAIEHREVILCEADKGIASEDLETMVKGIKCRILQSEQKDLGTRYEEYAKQLFAQVKGILKSKSKGHVLVQIVVFTIEDKEIFRGLGGLLKTAQAENPRLLYQIIQLPAGTGLEEIADKLEEDGRNPKDSEIRYDEGIRYIKILEEARLLDRGNDEELPWKEGGVYLVTGGAGGLGLVFAGEIAQKVKGVKLILTGRSELNEKKQVQLNALKEMGAIVEYRCVDITAKGQVKGLVAGILETFGGLDGILHSAGIIRDNYIINKLEEEFVEVLKPKVSGLLNVDECTKDLNLDFIVLFSSQSGELGNPGQADYAAANGFMDAFAGYRNKLVQRGERRGKTLSINWPLWEQGGMHIGKEVEKIVFEKTGIIPLKTETGIKAFYKALYYGNDQEMVFEGDIKKLREVFVAKETSMELPEKNEAEEERHNSKTVDHETLREKAETYFKKLLSSVIKLPVNRIEAEASMENYGIDSLMIMQMTDELEKVFGSLSKTLFFEYQNIKALSGYFIESHRDKLTALLGIEKKKEQPGTEPQKPAYDKKPLELAVRKPKRSRFAFSAIPALEKPAREDIAIIGLAGRYPQARNIGEFWENLCRGKDCITEIPKERWDYNLYYDEDKHKAGKTYSKWGGFLDDVDKFDPLFFNITPHEAEFMDPQERLFLECAFEVLEDAGYTRETLSRYQGFGLEGNVGVYVGVMYDEYQLYGAQEQIQGRMLALNGIISSVANRVSYYCNFHGPSIGINTMCSSSLVAVHLACQGILHGGCELAIAGGVNVSIHPNKYLLLGQSKFVSSKGRCGAFGKGGDGYVPGEGVGAILLKPLSKAIEDRDQIYGVIKGSTINHGGKTSGYTVPNPTAQTSMIKEALKNARVDARSISYIEAHGTGTSLGDPIEITALTNAFEDYTQEKQFCAIGSIKSNIGHLESAAGIVGLTKVLLQVKYGKLVPSLHSKVLNPNIDFEKTPFRVQQELEEWKRPVIEKNGEKKEYPRIAGISAFGAGGSNAHIVIEEYIPESEQHPVLNLTDESPAIIILSGKNEDKLKERARRLLREIEKGNFEDKDLPDMAYTLQTGREAMEMRLGVIVTSIRELEEKLRGFLEGQEDLEDMYIGRVKKEKDTLAIFRADEDLQKAIDSWINKRKYRKLLDFWVKGLMFDWERLYREAKPKRISLPTYPFARERYWIPQVETDTGILMRSHLKPGVMEEKAWELEEPLEIREDKEQLTQSLLKEKTVNYFKELFSSVGNIPLDRIEADVSLETYGIDSIMITRLSGELEKSFESIQATIFFEYQDIQSLAEYFLYKYKSKLMELFQLNYNKNDGIEADKKPVQLKAAPLQAFTYSQKPSDFSKLQLYAASVNEGKNDEIAVIGISGRYPEAMNVNEFWENLKAGKDCVGVIPKERWDYTRYYDENKLKAGKINSKWGGFINDIDKFDPLFFNISPEEAEFMDPQERLFLQCVYETIEDAGYTREALGKSKNLGMEGNVGVFVGVTFVEYHLYGVQSQMKGRNVAFSGIPSTIANRVSYFCNFNGPSMSIDSMCSSSLTALHVACDSIKQGSCKLALVGGVNLSLHPNKYLFLSQYHFLSSKGRCEAFGSGGDGYVPGEGVGAILLKPLSQAEADGDQIYGIIKSTAINHGGKTNGYSVPNPGAQANVISKALIDAKINPRCISYIEAHGTGTSLGDPIEIAGLTKAFSEYTDDRGFCAIGSAKSNIGHLEAAAGIAGVSKVLLQIKYKKLVPSLHSEVLNSNINFNNTPFKVQRKLEEWVRPVIEVGGENKQYPRIAGISAFGAGGANGHVIIEEYIPKNEEQNQIVITEQNPGLIVLSAKNEDRLKGQVKRLLEAVNNQRFEDKDLAGIAYTLQTGREAMEERLGLTVKSIDDLKEKLEGFLSGKNNIADLFRSQEKRQKNILSLLKSNEELKEAVDKCIERRKYKTLLELWTAGMEIDWEKLYFHNKPKRVSLPAYPFARERYWHPALEAATMENSAGSLKAAGCLHPLLHRNTSNLEGQRFSSTFTGDEFFLRDHVVMGEKILPGSACLEMIRAAIDEYVPKGHERAVKLKNIVWSIPFVVSDKSQDIHIGIYPEGDGEFGYEIYSEGSDIEKETVVHCAGQSALLLPGESKHSEFIDVGKLKAECSDSILTGKECYEKFRSQGLDYGSGHQGIENLYAGDGKVLAKLIMPEAEGTKAEDYVLHPGLLDSAIQAAIFLSTGSESIKPWYPFALEELEVIDGCVGKMWAFTRKSDGVDSGDKIQKLDIDLFDENGKICVRMKNFAFRAVETGSSGKADTGSIMLQPVWKESCTVQQEKMPDIVQREIILCEAGKGVTARDLESMIKGVRCLMLQSEEQDLGARYEEYSKQLFTKIKTILKSKPKGNVLIQVAMFTGKDKEYFGGLAGVLKTAWLENPRLLYQMLYMPCENGVERIVQKLEENSRSLKDREVRYDEGVRYVKSLEETGLAYRSNGEELPWKEGGVYLITGGAGGLGFIFAEEISRKVKDAKLILTGRSKLNEGKQAQLDALEEIGATVQYRRVDITEKEQVKGLVDGIVETFGGLNGILHSAGIIRDNYIINKTEEEFVEVLKPKVTGLLNIDECTYRIGLDFIVLFSSRTAEFGNPGQADYAAANAFMDTYAVYRNKLAHKGERCGKTLSINWPLWENGGMHIDKEIKKIMFDNTGMTPMKTGTGMKALYKALSQENGRVMVMEGDTLKIRQKILLTGLKEAANQPSGSSASVHSPLPATEKNMDEANIEVPKEKVIQKLTELFGESMKLSVNKIDTEELFDAYGVDSIKLTLLNQSIAEHFKEVSNTLFFEYQTLSALGEYLASEHPYECMKWIGNGKETQIENLGKGNQVTESRALFPVLSPRRGKPFITKGSRGGKEASSKDDEPIAVIGVSGRFPMAKNLDEFWENLKSGKDCITELPKERWSLEEFYNPDREEAIAKKQSFSKWGGFLEGFADFDPLFFNISPPEAERMDPQERIYLEECWKAFEDAGYVPSKIAAGLRKQIGVFGGITKTGFGLWNNTSNKFFNTSFSSLVNRLSYFMDFHGPSVAVDTMCSSSLAALHQACESIRHGEIKIAVVGAVNLYLHPSNYSALSQAGLISDSPYSSVFGKGGIGFIPSEGVGAVVLKRLSDAEKDGDNILALIKASAVSHSGKTNGYNIPDPEKQADVIRQALDSANLDPRTIRHIEAAASGSEMVDTIEISAISKVFQRYVSQQNGYYTMSSVKSVLGHGEAVSGMAQFIKSLLQLKHKMLCPTNMPEQLNPNVKFDTLPFKIETDLVEWPDMDIDGEKIPRRIGINSFGAGGVYAHLVLEEYVKPAGNKAGIPSNDTPNLFVFSAKTNHSLKRYLKLWKEYLAKHPETDPGQLAYILQTRREAMKRRFACIAQNLEELINNIDDRLNDVANKNIYTGNIGNVDDLQPAKQNSVNGHQVDNLVSEKDLSELAQLWVDGVYIPWNILYENYAPGHISQLPTYPFRRKQFWLNVKEDNHPDISENLSFTSLDSILGVQPGENETPTAIYDFVSSDPWQPWNNVDENGFTPLETCLQPEENNYNRWLTINQPEESPAAVEIQEMIRKILYEILYLDDLDEFDNEANFMELGLDSILTIKFIQKINTELGLNLRETVMFDYPNAFRLANYIASNLKLSEVK